MIHSRSADTSVVNGKPQTAESRQISTQAVLEIAAGFATNASLSPWTGLSDAHTKE